MTLVSPEVFSESLSAKTELDERIARRGKLALLSAEFAKVSIEQREANWRELVERTAQIIEVSDGSSYVASNKRHAARSESGPIPIAEHSGIVTTLTFAMSHARTPKINGHDLSGTSYMTVFKKCHYREDNTLEIDRGLEHISWSGLIEHPDTPENTSILSEYLTALSVAEQSLISIGDSQN